MKNCLIYWIFWRATNQQNLDRQTNQTLAYREMMTISNLGKTLFASFVILGIAGWIILVIPDLHFLYKDYLDLLGQLKLLAPVPGGSGDVFCDAYLAGRQAIPALTVRARPLSGNGHFLYRGYLAWQGT